MSAEILRRAAALMRERAEAASTDGPWTAGTYADEAAVLADNGDLWIAKTGYTSDATNDAAHIASWHPTVALAVAELIDDGAGYLEYLARAHPDETRDDKAQFFLAVARAYLGDPTDPVPGSNGNGTAGPTA